MITWIARNLLGMDNTLQVLDVRISFAFGVPGWLVAFLIILAGVYSYRIYKLEASDLDRRYRLGLTTLRFLTWALVIVVVLRPHLDIDRVVEPKANLAVLLDTSESMSLTDRQPSEDYAKAVIDAAEESGEGTIDSLSAEQRQWVEETPRIEVLKTILNNPQLDLIGRLREKYNLRFFAFDRDCAERQILPDAEDEALELPAAQGKLTQLGQALRMSVAQLRGLPLAGVLAFTDGAHNKGEEPEMVAKALGEQGIPVYAVGIGAPDALDIEVLDTNIADLVFKDDEIAVRVVFRASGLNGVSVPVTLTLGDKQVGSGNVTAVDGKFQQEFVIKPTETGDLIFKAEVPKQADEYFVENNVLQRRVRVIDSAIRILILVDTPSWEYRYLKGFLNSDTRIDTKVLIRRGDLRRSQSDPEYLDRFPEWDDLRRNYDCLILNNITADYFSQEQMQQIQRYVADEGGSLIMISSTKGTPGTFIDTPVGDILPVLLKRIPEDPSLDLERTFSTGYQLALTRDGKHHIVTRLAPLQEENLKLWTMLPQQYWYYTGITRLKPTAISLVEHATARNEYGRIPLIALHRYGRGQVLFSGLNSIWRWRYRIGNRYTNRFWAQTIQFMGLPHLLGNLKRVQFDTQGRDFMEGEAIPMTVRVMTPSFQPIQDQQITLTARENRTGDTVEFSLHTEGDKLGVFQGQIILKEGNWTIVVRDYEQEEQLLLDIRPPMFEYAQPAMQRSRLEAVATMSGGAFVELGALKDLPKTIGDKLKPTRARSETPLWDTWLTLMLITALTAVEWVLRKRKDMP